MSGFRHPCEIIYELSDKPIYGETKGICRIIGKESIGVPFHEWVGENFTDFSSLYPGDIVSNAACFCFSDENEFLRRKLGRSERTRFRNYSHFVVGNEWFVYTKAQKREMFRLLTECNPTIAVISDSGQRHLLFRYRYGFWQFEFQYIRPNVQKLRMLVDLAEQLLEMGFTKSEIQSGLYSSTRKLDSIVEFEKIENLILPFRGSKILDLAIWFSGNVSQNKEVKNGEN